MELLLVVIVFVIVGIIVSLDVGALTISKSARFADHPNDAKKWGFINALWHAGLLLGYILVISGIIWVAPLSLDYLIAFIQSIGLPDGVVSIFVLFSELIITHLPIILSFVALVIVIDTYSDKLTGEPEAGRLSDLPTLARLFLNLWDLFLRVFRRKQISIDILALRMHWNVQAALVAVDMLALAVLLKGMGMLDTWWERGLVCVIVFLVVGLCTWWLADFSGKKFANVKNHQVHGQINFVRLWLLLNFRLLEPLFIFYFLIQLLIFLWFEEFLHSPTVLIAAAILLWSLVRKVSLKKIVSAAMADYAESTGGEDAVRSVRVILSDSLQIIGRFVLALFITLGVVIYLAFIAYCVHVWNPQKIISFEEIISYGVSMAILIGSVFYLVLGNWYLVRFESFFKTMYKRVSSISNLLCVICVALLLSVVIPLVDSLPWDSRLLFSERQKHVIQFSIWIFYLFVLSILVIISKRKLIALARRGGYERSQLKREWEKRAKILISITIATLPVVGQLQGLLGP